MLSNFVSVFPSREVQEWTLLDPSLLWKYPLNNIFNVQNIQHFNTNIFRLHLWKNSSLYLVSLFVHILILFFVFELPLSCCCVRDEYTGGEKGEEEARKTKVFHFLCFDRVLNMFPKVLLCLLCHRVLCGFKVLLSTRWVHGGLERVREKPEKC